MQRLKLLGLALFVCALGLQGACSRQRLRHVEVPTPADANRVPLSAHDEAQLQRSAEAAWRLRDDPNVLAGVIGDLEALYAQRPDQADLGAKLGRAYFMQARLQRHGHNKEAMQQSLARGVITAERALASLYPEMANPALADPIVSNLNAVDGAGMDALTWYVSNLGAYAASRGATSLIFYRDRVTAILERMLIVDPQFLQSTPHRYWAIYLARAPAFAGGNMEQARIHFDKALTAHPGFFANACDYAQFYAVPKKDRALFEKLLNNVVRGDADALPELAPEMRMEQQRARELLGQVEVLF